MNLPTILEGIVVFIDFLMLEVKVPINFSGTAGWTLGHI